MSIGVEGSLVSGLQTLDGPSTPEVYLLVSCFLESLVESVGERNFSPLTPGPSRRLDGSGVPSTLYLGLYWGPGPRTSHCKKGGRTSEDWGPYLDPGRGTEGRRRGVPDVRSITDVRGWDSDRSRRDGKGSMGTEGRTVGTSPFRSSPAPGEPTVYPECDKS